MTPAKFKIITKEYCPHSKMLKEWLSDKSIYWEEIDYMDPLLEASVLKDDEFTSNYCEIGGCVENTPIIVKNGKEYYYSEIWNEGMQSINEEKALKVFDL
ncbi:MAG: hypothetical protein JW891_08230 [Candidatus Lokiarchaeota archaeon]|nr:hypothetical protein [Candidatus Lokiarchaeota archaeon]